PPGERTHPAGHTPAGEKDTSRRALPSHLRLPPLAVLPAPQRRRLLVVDDRARLRVEGERPAGAVGDVAQVAQERALLAFLDVRVGPLAAADAVEEVGEVDGVAGGAAALVDLLALDVEDLVGGAAGDRQGALVAVEGDEAEVVGTALVAAAAVPDGDLVAEIEGGDGGVGRLLVVLVVVAAAAAGDAPRAADAQAPAGHVQG